ncbi:kinetochore protein [Tasmannia lanceolata]|uniref:kinetochore protein n=1 Tax=Tasmannia lanceolata TaxID=3420 RepID=UPI00406284F2
MKGRRPGKSTAGTTQAAPQPSKFFSARDSDASYSSRPSSIGPTRSSSIIPPINDRSYQTSAIRTINNYLSSHSSSFLLRPPLPSAREITETLKFILFHLNFTETLNSKLEDELPIILRLLSCPYPLKPSLLKTPSTPHAWPHLLPIIHWLVEIARFSDHRSSDPPNFYSDGNDLLPYILQAYSHFIHGDDDSMTALDEMYIGNLREQTLDASNTANSLFATVQTLENQIQNIRSTPSNRQKLENEKLNLIEDEQKFHSIVDSYSASCVAKEKELKEREEELVVKEEEILKIGEENKELRKQREMQSFEVRDAERMRREMQAVEREIDEAKDGRDAWEGKVLDLDATIRHKLKELESLVDDCNQAVRRLKLRGDFQYLLNPKGSTRAEVLGIDYKSTLEPAFAAMADDLQKNKLVKSQELISLEQQLQDYEKKLKVERERLVHLESKIDEVEAQVNLMKKEIEDHLYKCATEAERLHKTVEVETHNLVITEREAEETLKNCQQKLQYTIKQSDEDVQMCAQELLALIDAVSQYKEHMESLVSTMRTELSETARYVADKAEAYKNSLTAMLLTDKKLTPNIQQIDNKAAGALHVL